MSYYAGLKAIYEAHERWLMPGILLSGVTADFVTFRTIRIETTFALLGIYLLAAGLAIGWINTPDASRPTLGGKLRSYVGAAAPMVLQFAFGALLSASFIFYWFSGALSVSWPLLLLTAFLMASNDVFRRWFLKPIVQVTVYFFVLFSLGSLVLPYFFNSVSAWVYVLGGCLSLAAMYGYLHLLLNFAGHLRPIRPMALGSVGAVFVVMNLLYFTGIIPPIPLSVREAGVYHGVERTGTDYTLLAERESLLGRLVPGQVVHVHAPDRVYVFSSVFAPVDLEAEIAHHWFRFDETSGEWVDRGRPSFPIRGGREGGYRGFSYTSGVEEGRWRVDIETQRGQVLGRVRFRIELVEEAPRRIELIR